MRRGLAAAVALLLPAGLILFLRSAPPPEEQYRAALEQLRNGEFDSAATAAHKFRTPRFWDKARPPEWVWRFRLLEVEALLDGGKPAEAMALLDSAMPEAAPEYEVRRR